MKIELVVATRAKGDEDALYRATKALIVLTRRAVPFNDPRSMAR